MNQVAFLPCFRWNVCLARDRHFFISFCICFSWVCFRIFSFCIPSRYSPFRSTTSSQITGGRGSDADFIGSPSNSPEIIACRFWFTTCIVPFMYLAIHTVSPLLTMDHHALSRYNCRIFPSKRTVKSFCTFRIFCSVNISSRCIRWSSLREICISEDDRGSTRNWALNFGRNISSRNIFASGMVEMFASLSSLTSLSWSVAFMRSTRPFPWGEWANMSSTQSSLHTRPNCVVSSWSSVAFGWLIL